MSSKTKSCLVKAWNEQIINSEVGILPINQRTDTLLLGSQNTLVVIHAEKLVSSGTDHFGTDLQKSKPVPLEV